MLKSALIDDVRSLRKKAERRRRATEAAAFSAAQLANEETDAQCRARAQSLVVEGALRIFEDEDRVMA